ncbi:hypothetical protein H6G33_32300 [Calothrix sp. FACHB-1219]|uniref:hypothetical protein n=1 Tax=unclassified Calothrix TaxID=2619626 RepID=UPI001687B3FF|nr:MULTISPECIES: hypothetical protein [unclassified Calothrix]MBD2207035.1 hypothetical protein [Calothrix sp. FACHB-168]MBD2221651.1 hypothetical protein [Calothrix sp. FACHB-1219]
MTPIFSSFVRNPGIACWNAGSVIAVLGMWGAIAFRFLGDEGSVIAFWDVEGRSL